MKKEIKKIIKSFIPPIIFDIFKKPRQYGFFGNYNSWSDARSNSNGYDSPEILERVKKSLLKVKNGEVAYERDSVTFSKIQYSWPVLSSMLWTASKNNRLNVLDFGGSLGSSYYQNRNFLSHIADLTWNVIEQKNFVECGKKFFQDDTLKFYNDEEMTRCISENKIDTLLVSSVIQYIEDPYQCLQDLLSLNIGVIIFDRTTFLKNEDRLTVQKVRPEIYNTSYPAWFLNEEKFLKIMGQKYILVSSFDSLFEKIDLGDKQACEKGFIFRSK